MCNIKYNAIVFVLLITGCSSSHHYPGSCGTISEYENFIRWNPNDARVDNAKQIIVNKATSGTPWDEISRHLAKLDDIDGARYDDENGRLVIWGPESKAGSFKALPPLLLDDFAVALTVLKSGQNPGVSIGTVSGHVPTQEEIEQVMSTEKLPIEYIPPSIFGTHMGSVLLEIDRCLKGLAHGEDNLTRQPVNSSIPGYIPVSRRLRHDDTWEVDKPRPLGLWWFVPDETGVAFEGYTIKFVRYRMRVEYQALIDDPAVAAFGKHLNEHFEDFAKEFSLFQELVRLHKLVQVARWYKESGFPTNDFQQQYNRLAINTPKTTKMIQTLANSKTIPGPYPGSYYIQQSFLIGGIDLSPGNYYIPVSSLPATNLTPGKVTHWQPREYHSVWTSPSPPRYGSFTTSPAPVPSFVTPIFQARPSATSYGWTTKLSGRNYAVVSIPVNGHTQAL